MIADRPVLRLFLDEGVPDSVGHAFLEAGHHVAFLNRSLARGSSDHLVCTIAEINSAILVALDGDMKLEPEAAARVRSAMSLIEHEWKVTEGQDGRRIFVEISDSVMRSFR